MRLVPYQALRERAAWINLTGRGFLRVGDEDRARLLHAMTTNHVQQLTPGQSLYAFFLNAQGRILADVQILCAEDAFLLDTEPETTTVVAGHLDRYIIADAVTVEDLTAQTFVIGLEGPEAWRFAQELGIDPAPAPGHWVRWNEWITAGITVTGLPGYRLYGPRAELDQIIGRLSGQGLIEAGLPEWNVVRLEHGLPRYGVDFTDRQIPQETQLMNALHFNKGCYLGQEIVERVRSRGQVHRKLVRLRIDGEQPPPTKSKLLAGEKEAGEITSAAFSPANRCAVALGYVRTEAIASGAPLLCQGRLVELVS
jgi:aminomethyltransferase